MDLGQFADTMMRLPGHMQPGLAWEALYPNCVDLSHPSPIAFVCLLVALATVWFLKPPTLR
jgi:hypothetical protein